MCKMNFMKKIIYTIMALTILGTGYLKAPVASALVKSADDTSIDQSLEDAGAKDAPKSIEIAPTTTYGLEETSGFVDDNGKPISRET